MPIWPFGGSAADRDAQRLLDSVVAASRRPEFFGGGRIPDTLEGRFELAALHAGLALIRLRADAEARPLAQAFTDRFFRHLDAGLREAGVGDLVVAKRMRKLAGSFYGRLEAYSAALAGGDRGQVEAAVGRNVLGDESHPFRGKLAAYAMETVRGEAPAAALFEAGNWPPLER